MAMETKGKQMINSAKAIEDFQKGLYDSLLQDIYVDEKLVVHQRERYINAMFSKLGSKEVSK